VDIGQGFQRRVFGAGIPAPCGAGIPAPCIWGEDSGAVYLGRGFQRRVFGAGIPVSTQLRSRSSSRRRLGIGFRAGLTQLELYSAKDSGSESESIDHGLGVGVRVGVGVEVGVGVGVRLIFRQNRPRAWTRPRTWNQIRA